MRNADKNKSDNDSNVLQKVKFMVEKLNSGVAKGKGSSIMSPMT